MIDSGIQQLPKPNNQANLLSNVLYITYDDIDFNLINLITHEVDGI